MKKSARRIILIVSLISLSAALSLAQVSDNFTSLRDSRAKLLLEIPQVKQELWDLKGKEKYIEYYEEDISRAKIDLEMSKKATPLDKRRIEDIQAFIQRTEEKLKVLKAKNLGAEIKNSN